MLNTEIHYCSADGCFNMNWSQSIFMPVIFEHMKFGSYQTCVVFLSPKRCGQIIKFNTLRSALKNSSFYRNVLKEVQLWPGTNSVVCHHLSSKMTS